MHRQAPLMTEDFMRTATQNAIQLVLKKSIRAQNPFTTEDFGNAKWATPEFIAKENAKAQALANSARLDSDKEARMLRHFCKACHYSGPRVAGQAFTSVPCMSCAEEMTFSTTSTDALCLSCAKDLDLCKKCGADIDLNAQRASWPKAKVAR